MEKIYVTVDNKRIEATGEILESIIDFQTSEKNRLEESVKLANEAKAKREALLERLGITEEEAKLLLG